MRPATTKPSATAVSCASRRGYATGASGHLLRVITTPINSASPVANSQRAPVSSGCAGGAGGGLGAAIAWSPIEKLERPRTSCRSSRSRTPNPIWYSPSPSAGRATTSTLGSSGSTVPTSRSSIEVELVRNDTSMNSSLIGSLNRTRRSVGAADSKVPSAGVDASTIACASAGAAGIISTTTRAATTPMTEPRAHWRRPPPPRIRQVNATEHDARSTADQLHLNDCSLSVISTPPWLSNDDRFRQRQLHGRGVGVVVLGARDAGGDSLGTETNFFDSHRPVGQCGQ